MEATVKARRYDSTNRQNQAAQTQRRILDAALALFERDGYANTTMAAIAEKAGVAVQTVYVSTRSKRDILKRLLDLAVSGDDPVPVAASQPWRQLEAESDPIQKLRLFVELHTQICTREAPVFAVASEAAGADSDIRLLIQEMAELRYKDQHRLARSLQRDGHLRPGLSARTASDIIWALASERVYLALVHERGWSPEPFRQWLTQQLATSLLGHC